MSRVTNEQTKANKNIPPAIIHREGVVGRKRLEWSPTLAKMAYERTKLEQRQAEQQLTWTWENSSCSYLPYRQHENFSHSSTTWTRSLQQQYSNRAGKRRTFLPAQGMGESRVTNWNLPSSWTHTLTNTELESLVERPPHWNSSGTPSTKSRTFL